MEKLIEFLNKVEKITVDFGCMGMGGYSILIPTIVEESENMVSIVSEYNDNYLSLRLEHVKIEEKYDIGCEMLLITYPNDEEILVTKSTCF